MAGAPFLHERYFLRPIEDFDGLQQPERPFTCREPRRHRPFTNAFTRTIAMAPPKKEG